MVVAIAYDGNNIVGLEQERTSCNSGETEKIEKQTSPGV